MTAAGDGSSSNVRPTYLLSSERSGSNLLRSILNTHSEISAPHPIETAYPWQNLADPSSLSADRRRRLIRDVLVNKRYSYHPMTVPLDPERVADRVEADDNPSFLSVQSAIYREICRIEDTSMWSTKYPGLWDCLWDAFEYYDDLRIVYLVRDPRDVVLSFKTSNIDLYHPYFSAQRWQEEQAVGTRLLEEYQESVHLIRYEDLLQEPEREVEAVCEFLGIPFEEAMLYYYETEDAQTASESSELFENVGVPIKSDNYDKYLDRLPNEEVRLTEYFTQEELRSFGYEPSYSEEDLDSFDPDSANHYRKLDRSLGRSARIDHWREAPAEQVRRSLTKSFTAYLYLRYGVLA